MYKSTDKTRIAYSKVRLQSQYARNIFYVQVSNNCERIFIKCLLHYYKNEVLKNTQKTSIPNTKYCIEKILKPSDKESYNSHWLEDYF